MAGSANKLAARIGVAPATISVMRSGGPISDKFSRRLEDSLLLPAHWMDSNSDDAESLRNHFEFNLGLFSQSRESELARRRAANLHALIGNQRGNLTRVCKQLGLSQSHCLNILKSSLSLSKARAFEIVLGLPTGAFDAQLPWAEWPLPSVFSDRLVVVRKRVAYLMLMDKARKSAGSAQPDVMLFELIGRSAVNELKEQLEDLEFKGLLTEELARKLLCHMPKT